MSNSDDELVSRLGQSDANPLHLLERLEAVCQHPSLGGAAGIAGMLAQSATAGAEAAHRFYSSTAPAQPSRKGHLPSPH